ncbi:MAG: hypothetical protein RJB10_1126, partial [Pseudomonadota bacterium]
MHQIHHQTLSSLRSMLLKKESSAPELAQHFLARIKANAALGAFLATDEEITLAQARAAQTRIDA